LPAILELVPLLLSDVVDALKKELRIQSRRVENMREKAEYETHAGFLITPKLRIVRNKYVSDDFEGRLDYLESRAKVMQADPSIVWVKSQPHIYDANLDLQVKIEAIRWMVRVSKHLEEPARQRVLVTIRKSIDDLERSVGPESHAA
jgi:hypothetical protein